MWQMLHRACNNCCTERRIPCKKKANFDCTESSLQHPGYKNIAGRENHLFKLPLSIQPQLIAGILNHHHVIVHFRTWNREQQTIVFNATRVFRQIVTLEESKISAAVEQQMFAHLLDFSQQIAFHHGNPFCLYHFVQIESCIILPSHAVLAFRQ